MANPEPLPEFSDAECLIAWEQAAKELMSVATAFNKTNAQITGRQLQMAIALANRAFAEMQKKGS